MSTPFHLILPEPLHIEMLQHAQTERPRECCGLLAGRIAENTATVLGRYPLVNELASPTAYRSEPLSILRAYRDIDRQGLEVVAVYHSHPTSPPLPSWTDLTENYLGQSVVHFIISLLTDPPTMNGWWLLKDSYLPAAWKITDVLIRTENDLTEETPQEHG